MRKIFLFFALIFNFLLLSAQQPQFRFAVISDTHISAEKPQNSDDLSNVIADINRQQGIAFVLAAGDITDNGDLKSLTEAKKLLGKLNVPFFVVAGNHDTKKISDFGLNFKKVFGDDKFRHSFNGFFFLGLSSGQYLNANEGHFSAENIAWLKRALKNIGKKKPIFFITHHPLKNGDVDNWYEVTDVLREYNTQAAIAGHYHKNLLLNFDGISGVLNRTTQRGGDTTAHYTIYEMADSLYIFDKQIGKVAEKWHALAIEQKYFPNTDTKYFPRSNFNVTKEYKNAKEVWVKRLESDIYAPPAVSGGDMFFGATSGEFFCFDIQKGKQKWSFRTLDKIVGKAAVTGDKVIFGSADKNVYCLDKNTGKLIWKYQHDKPIFEGIETGEGLVSFFDDKYGVALNISDGTFFSKDKIFGETFIEKNDFLEKFTARGKYNFPAEISENEYIFTTTNGFFGRIIL